VQRRSVDYHFYCYAFNVSLHTNLDSAFGCAHFQNKTSNSASGDVSAGAAGAKKKKKKSKKKKAPASAAGPAQVEIPPFVFLAFACCVYIAYFVDEQ